MQRFILRQNILNFQKALEAETSEARRQTPDVGGEMRLLFHEDAIFHG